MSPCSPSAFLCLRGSRPCCCLALPAAAPPPLPRPTPPLAVLCPPFASSCCRACRWLSPPPPSPGVFVLRPLASWSAFSLVLPVPCGWSAPLGRFLAPPAHPPPGFVFCRCRRPAACLPLFFFCLCAAWAFAPPPVLCFGVLLLLPSASACWRAVMACSVLVLCGLVLLLAVLCCSRCGVPCRFVPCLFVSCGWCCAALRFLVRLRPAACSALLSGAVLCCCRLRRSLGCCVLLLCAAPSHCVLLWVALRYLLSVGVVLLAACCAVLYGAVLCCAVLCCCVLRCAFQGGVWLRCAVPSLLWLAVSSWLRCCVLCCAS